MPGLEIPCPQCGKLHVVPDARLLGRKGRCKRCGNKFLLHLPPPVGPFASTEEPPEAPAEWKSSGRAAKRPPAQAAPPEQRAADLDGPPEASQTAQFAKALLAEAAAPAAVASLRRRRTPVWKWSLAAGVVGALAIAASAFLGPAASRGHQQQRAKGASRNGQSGTAPQSDGRAPSASRVERKGKPLALHLVPMSARVLVHIRPAELWSQGGTAEEVRACLGPLGLWLEEQIKQQCLLDPTLIEEATFALVPTGQEAFDVSVVVRSTQDLKRSELIDRFDGELVNSPRPHYAGAARVYLIHDARTFAVAPKDLAEELFESVDRPAALSEGLQPLVSRTNRHRHLTVLCELNDVRLGARALAPASAQELLHQVLDFAGDDVESAAWSLRLGDADSGTTLQSHLVLRSRAGRSSASLERELQTRLAALPARILALVYQTDPLTVGEKKVIGRFPIMTKILEQSTAWTSGPRFVEASVELPERAGPNLALGALLTWNQSTLPGFRQSSGDPANKVPVAGNAAGSIADRLRTRISVEFNNKFLKEAIFFIGEEIGVEFKLDGPGMQRVGVTQNQRQDLKAENTPASEILYEMLVKRFKDRELCLIVDEQKKQAIITSQVVATEKKLSMFPLGP